MKLRLFAIIGIVLALCLPARGSLLSAEAHPDSEHFQPNTPPSVLIMSESILSIICGGSVRRPATATADY